MRTGRRRWRVLGAIVAAVALAACATDVGGPTAQSAAGAEQPGAPAPTGAAPATTVTTATTVPTAASTATTAEPDTTRDSAPRAGDADDPDGVGDELFPALGNPGLDVQHYDVELTYDHDARSLQGTVGLDVRFTEDRAEFTLDADGPIVDAVTIDGSPVDFRQDGAELRITTPLPVLAGDIRRVEVTYHLQPDSRMSATGIPVGWFNTDGGSYVLNEPDGANSWLPSNDHPSDKATYDFTVHVGPGVTAVANGALVEHTTTADGETWRWREDEPMATYLVQLLTGDYELVEGTGPGGLPLVSAILRSELPAAQDELDSISEQVATLEAVLGPYPLERYGIAVTDSFPGLAMETQGRSQYSKDDLGPNGFGTDPTFVHELAHQWFGNAVTPARWQDIWLNEGFATYAQLLYAERVSGPQGPVGPLTPDSGLGPIGEPTAANMFDRTTYDGGSMLLGALRETIGDDQFFELLRRWVADNDGTSRTTDDFVALAEEISGRELTAFFDEWLLGGSPEPAAATTTTTG